jgi:hypothetical protein
MTIAHGALTAMALAMGGARPASPLPTIRAGASRARRTQTDPTKE